MLSSRHPAKRRTASADVVRHTLGTYAKRGIFRGYGEQPSRAGRCSISFRWHADAVFRVEYDPARRTLIFRDVLPHVGARSSMYRDLRAFVKGTTSRTLPEHRRINPQKADVGIVNRKGMVSLRVRLKNPHLEYGVRKTVVLIHELFVEFLRNPLYHPYMVEHFGVEPDQ